MTKYLSPASLIVGKRTKERKIFAVKTEFLHDHSLEFRFLPVEILSKQDVNTLLRQSSFYILIKPF